ncbi:flagellar hook-length control protein FliK [Natronincola ferrireducens]|uniref:Hook-length control protein FliK n=1 Tax=Natronincola ferrireducens TaxID=393762 RepID=A0A1G9C0Y7_9FIRM|nr:flagellar hook-length control protein FliK [Natronincola ferrireducens]SDK45389.1 hook-length control protein FliK [Natronincola ferrireducens]
MIELQNIPDINMFSNKQQAIPTKEGNKNKNFLQMLQRKLAEVDNNQKMGSIKTSNSNTSEDRRPVSNTDANKKSRNLQEGLKEYNDNKNLKNEKQDGAKADSKTDSKEEKDLSLIDEETNEIGENPLLQQLLKVIEDMLQLMEEEKEGYLHQDKEKMKLALDSLGGKLELTLEIKELLQSTEMLLAGEEGSLKDIQIPKGIMDLKREIVGILEEFQEFHQLQDKPLEALENNASKLGMETYRINQDSSKPEEKPKATGDVVISQEVKDLGVSSKQKEFGEDFGYKGYEEIELDEQLDEYRFNTELPKDFQIKSIHSSKEFINDKTLHTKNILEQIVHKMDGIYKSGKNQLKLQLTPENLGKLSIDLLTSDQTIKAKVYVESLQVKEVIESNLNQFKESLRDKGLNISSIDVSVGQDPGTFHQERSYGQQKIKLKKSSYLDDDNLIALGEGDSLAIKNPYMINTNFDKLV